MADYKLRIVIECTIPEGFQEEVFLRALKATPEGGSLSFDITPEGNES